MSGTNIQISSISSSSKSTQISPFSQPLAMLASSKSPPPSTSEDSWDKLYVLIISQEYSQKPADILSKSINQIKKLMSGLNENSKKQIFNIITALSILLIGLITVLI